MTKIAPPSHCSVEGQGPISSFRMPTDGTTAVFGGEEPETEEETSGTHFAKSSNGHVTWLNTCIPKEDEQPILTPIRTLIRIDSSSILSRPKAVGFQLQSLMTSSIL